MKRGLNVVFGGQAGSEGKGKVAAYLAEKFDIKHFACSLSPNAGHTVIRGGQRTVTHHFPAGLAGARNLRECQVAFGPATIINPQVFLKEVDWWVDRGLPVGQIMVDPRCAIINDQHLRLEASARMDRIGSTLQGVGEARCARLMRVNCMRAWDLMEFYGLVDRRTPAAVRSWAEQYPVLYEMGQGFDLCIDHGVDPIYCTSRNCTPMQALADMGVPPRLLGHVYAVLRTYPIRVNNRAGSSGPYPSAELTWAEVTRRCGAPFDLTELTTTTGLPRRVFEFAWDRIGEMVRVCDPDVLCLQFANYLDWGAMGMRDEAKLPTRVSEFIRKLTDYTQTTVDYIGTGPDHLDIVDRGSGL